MVTLGGKFPTYHSGHLFRHVAMVTSATIQGTYFRRVTMVTSAGTISSGNHKVGSPGAGPMKYGAQKKPPLQVPVSMVTVTASQPGKPVTCWPYQRGPYLSIDLPYLSDGLLGGP